MSLLKDIRHDIKNNINFKGRIIVVCFTFTNYFRKKASNKFGLLLCAPIIIIYNSKFFFLLLLLLLLTLRKISWIQGIGVRAYEST